MSFLVNNIIIWWRIFLIITLLFILLNKSNKRYSSIFNYFIIQERLGLIFLLFTFRFLQFFIVLIKIGAAPLHFWIFRVTNNVYNFGLVWFLTFQKLPFLLILLQLFFVGSFILVLVGLLVCYLQLFSIKRYKNLLIISSTESFNWIIIGCYLSFFNRIFLFFYYFFLIVLLINKFTKQSLNFVGWETTLVFLNLPFSVSFFVKIFSLREIFIFNRIYTLFLLFLIFLSVLSFSYWLINLSIKFNNNIQNNNKINYFFIIPLIVISLI